MKGEPVFVAVLGVGAVDDGFTPKVPEYQLNEFPDKAEATNCVDVDPSQYVKAVVLAVGADGEATTVNRIAVPKELEHKVVLFLEKA